MIDDDTTHTGPPLAVQISGRGRMYRHPVTEELYPSVTSCIGAIDKPALVGWAARETAKAAFANRDALMAMSDEDAAVDMLKNARYRSGGRAANLGTHIHEIAQALAYAGDDAPLPPISREAEPFADQFLQFVTDYDVRFRVVEGTVFSVEHGYAGTFDFLADIGGRPVLGDYKTGGSGIYSEVALQLAALRYAEELWDASTGDLRPMPEVAGCIAVWLRPERYVVYTVGADEAAFEAFLGARRLWPWVRGGGANDGVGAAMSPERLRKLLEAGA